MKDDIQHQRKNWDKLSEVDPYWSILVSPDKIDNKWDLNEFYSTGRIQINKLLNFVGNLGFEIHPKNALDYGCGTGRLSEALSETFDHVTGVDFSQNMINLAKAHSKYRNLNYETVNGEDLSDLPSNTFDFIISLITLQHSPPKIQIKILREMIRVIKDDGVIVVSVVTRMGLKNFLRNTVSSISPRLANLILEVRQKAIRKKIGHYQIGVASQMFPVSKRKVQATLRNLGMNYEYISTPELSYNGDSELELFIIYSSNRPATHP
jgi:ubiquinone/menaquinone biosynthesis C-methylase UbiE